MRHLVGAAEAVRRSADIGRLPTYDGDRLEREIEEELADTSGAGRAHDPFYARPRFDPRRFFGPGLP